MHFYALNLNMKTYVDIQVPFENLALTSKSLQLEHENELKILRKRLEQVGFTFACTIRCLSELENLHSSILII